MKRLLLLILISTQPVLATPAMFRVDLEMKLLSVRTRALALAHQTNLVFARPADDCTLLEQIEYWESCIKLPFSYAVSLEPMQVECEGEN